MIHRQLSALLCFVLLAVMLSANSFDTAFTPKIKSDMMQSFLLDSNPFHNAEPISGTYGFSHPFQSPSKFKDAILDAFRTESPRYALAKYNVADNKLSLRSELNFIAGYEHRWEAEENYGFIYKGFQFKSKINRHFYANALWWNGKYLGNRDAAEELSPLINGYFTHTATQTRLDKLNAELGYTDANLRLKLSRGRAQIGNNISSSIVLSDQVNDYGNLQAEIKLGTFQLSMMHASLVADSTLGHTRLADQQFPDKYLAHHQLSWTPTAELKILSGEIVVYGNRALDLNYLLPHTFWRVTEHNQHDRDNVLIYAAAEAQMNRHLSYWCTGAIDEMSYDKLFSSWWGNKWAVQSGFAYQWAEKSKAALEVTAVRPWTYTHYQNHTMYSHDSHPLGYADGSNLVKGSFELSISLISKIGWVGRTSFMRQGSIGNSWQQNYADHFPASIIDTAETKWFAGIRTDSFCLENLILIGPLAHHRFIVGHGYKDSTKHKHKFFAGWQFWY